MSNPGAGVERQTHHVGRDRAGFIDKPAGAGPRPRSRLLDEAPSRRVVAHILQGIVEFLACTQRMVVETANPVTLSPESRRRWNVANLNRRNTSEIVVPCCGNTIACTWSCIRQYPHSRKGSRCRVSPSVAARQTISGSRNSGCPRKRFRCYEKQARVQGDAAESQHPPRIVRPREQP